MNDDELFTSDRVAIADIAAKFAADRGKRLTPTETLAVAMEYYRKQRDMLLYACEALLTPVAGTNVPPYLNLETDYMTVEYMYCGCCYEYHTPDNPEDYHADGCPIVDIQKAVKEVRG